MLFLFRSYYWLLQNFWIFFTLPWIPVTNICYVDALATDSWHAPNIVFYHIDYTIKYKKKGICWKFASNNKNSGTTTTIIIVIKISKLLFPLENDKQIPQLYFQSTAKIPLKFNSGFRCYVLACFTFQVSTESTFSVGTATIHRNDKRLQP